MSGTFSTGGSVVDNESAKPWTSSVYDDEVYPVGTRRVEPADEVNAGNSSHYGDREWIFVYNDEASTDFAAGNVIMLDNGDYAPFHGLLSTATIHRHRILGVAGAALAAGKYGWIIAKGCGEVQCDGGVSQGDRIVSKASGLADSIVVNSDATTDTLECVIGMALEDDASSGTAFATCWINGTW